MRAVRWRLEMPGDLNGDLCRDLCGDLCSDVHWDLSHDLLMGFVRNEVETFRVVLQ